MVNLQNIHIPTPPECRTILKNRNAVFPKLPDPSDLTSLSCITHTTKEVEVILITLKLAKHKCQ